MREMWLPGSSISGHSARYALTPTHPNPIRLPGMARFPTQTDKVAGAKACAILNPVSPPTAPISMWVRKPDISKLHKSKIVYQYRELSFRYCIQYPIVGTLTLTVCRQLADAQSFSRGLCGL